MYLKLNSSFITKGIYSFGLNSYEYAISLVKVIWFGGVV